MKHRYFKYIKRHPTRGGGKMHASWWNGYNEGFMRNWYEGTW